MSYIELRSSPIGRFTLPGCCNNLARPHIQLGYGMRLMTNAPTAVFLSLPPHAFIPIRTHPAILSGIYCEQHRNALPHVGGPSGG